SSRRSLENQWRILLRARPERTKPSQSWEGPAFSSLSVKISTESPWFKTVLSGTRRSFTRAPTVRCPTCVCTLYAKSTGVEPDGSALISPFGVNTYTSAEPISVRKESKKSFGSDASCCQSSTVFNQPGVSASAEPPRL